MTQEKKAKAYDEAVRKAEEIIKYYKTHSRDGEASIEDLETIFPELKESEDERIKREILECVSIAGNGNQFEEIKDWLEKKTVIIPKFRVGDEIKTANEESLTITKIDERGYWSEDLFICSFEDADRWELIKQKPTLSKEDGIMLNKIGVYLCNYGNKVEESNEEKAKEIYKAVDWLIFFKLQNRKWKSSNTELETPVKG